MKKRIFKVRFHLGAGEHFMHWQVKNTETGEVTYHHPDKVRLELTDCFLRNQPAAANKIFNGASKTVCAWVEAREVLVTPVALFQCFEHEAQYNPKVAPYWRYKGEKADGRVFGKMASQNRKLRVVQEMYQPTLEEFKQSTGGEYSYAKTE